MAGWLKAAIEQAGITKFQLARDSGVPRSHIYKLLDGEVNPRWDIVQKLARALKASQPEMGKPAQLDREVASHQALLKQAIADLDHVARVLRDLREALVDGLIFKDRRRGRKPKGLARRSKQKRRRG
jgi:transcriptional regulator with XRE-family HTH domain